MPAITYWLSVPGNFFVIGVKKDSGWKTIGRKPFSDWYWKHLHLAIRLGNPTEQLLRLTARFTPQVVSANRPFWGPDYRIYRNRSFPSLFEGKTLQLLGPPLPQKETHLKNQPTPMVLRANSGKLSRVPGGSLVFFLRSAAAIPVGLGRRSVKSVKSWDLSDKFWPIFCGFK